MPEVRYRLVPDKVDESLTRAARLTPQLLTNLIEEVIERGRSNIAEETPVGWSGALRGGYATEVRGRNTRTPKGIIANPMLYHDVVEEGRRPGKMPPIEALVPWVGSKLGIPPGPERRSVAFLVARKIGRVGFPGAHQVETGWDKTRDEIRPRLKNLGLRIVRTIGT